jgi:hypothetical protein
MNSSGVVMNPFYVLSVEEVAKLNQEHIEDVSQ